MNSGANTANSPGCGSCRKKIRMRDDMHVVLCTAILDLVNIDEEVCEQYEKAPEIVRSFLKVL